MIGFDQQNVSRTQFCQHKWKTSLRAFNLQSLNLNFKGKQLNNFDGKVGEEPVTHARLHKNSSESDITTTSSYLFYPKILPCSQVLSLFTNKFWCPRYCRPLFCNMVSSNKLRTQMLHQYLTTTLPLPTVMLGRDTAWDETMLLSNQQIQPQWPWPMGSARMRPHCKSGIKDDQDIDRTSMMSLQWSNTVQGGAP